MIFRNLTGVQASVSECVLHIAVSLLPLQTGGSESLMHAQHIPTSTLYDTPAILTVFLKNRRAETALILAEMIPT